MLADELMLVIRRNVPSEVAEPCSWVTAGSVVASAAERRRLAHVSEVSDLRRHTQGSVGNGAGDREAHDDQSAGESFEVHNSHREG